jgi:hypothetical protein
MTDETQTTAAPAACPAAVPEPPAYMVDAVELALHARLVHYGFNLAPAALRNLAVDAIKAARAAALAQRLGSAH